MATGEIIGVFKLDHIFSPAETMAAFVADGGLSENWSRLFSLVIGTDGNYHDMKYLNYYKADGLTKKYFFNLPSTDSQEFAELYTTGQTSRDTAKIMSLIGSR